MGQANKTWDGSCDDWAKYYGVSNDTDPLTKIMNGTGPFVLDHWTAGQEIVLTANPTYWGGQGNKQPALKRVVVQIIPEWSTRFAELQTGDADIVDVPSREPLSGGCIGQPDACIRPRHRHIRSRTTGLRN